MSCRCKKKTCADACCPGPVGPPGPPGAQGPAGTNGVDGGAGVANVFNAVAEDVDNGDPVEFNNVGGVSTDTDSPVVQGVGNSEIQVGKAGVYGFDFLVRGNANELPITTLVFALAVNGVPLRAFSNTVSDATDTTFQATVVGVGAIRLAANDVVTLINQTGATVTLSTTPANVINAELTVKYAGA